MTRQRGSAGPDGRQRGNELPFLKQIELRGRVAESQQISLEDEVAEIMMPIRIVMRCNMLCKKIKGFDYSADGLGKTELSETLLVVSLSTG